MPFEPIIIAYTKTPRAPVLAAMYIQAKYGQAIEIVFTSAFMAEAGWDPETTKIGVSEGTGADSRLFQLAPAPTGYTLSKRGDKGEASIKMSVVVLRRHTAQPGKRSLQAVDFHRFGSTVTVNLQDFVEPI